MSLWRLWVIVPSMTRRWRMSLGLWTRDEGEGGVGREGRNG